MKKNMWKKKAIFIRMLNEDGVDKVVIYVADIKAIKRLNDEAV